MTSIRQLPLAAPGDCRGAYGSVLPRPPTEEPPRADTINLLRERGVDGIISFRSMLIDILDKVETNLNYQKSETLQILRILKNYNLIRKPQLELFNE